MNENRDCDCGCKPHIAGISCDVKNCTYHDGKCYCTAGQINVGTTCTSCTAQSSGETACVTFKPKAE